MKVRELIALLEQWPDDDIEVVQRIVPPGVVPSAQILGVTGFAGAAIDGHDSVVAIEVGVFNEPVEWKDFLGDEAEQEP
jgi:hypothetical protein